MRLVHGEWSPVVAPETAYPVAARMMVTEFDAWMKDLRGLSNSTRRYRRAEAYRLIAWLHEQGKTIGRVTVADLDAYIASRGAAMRRTSMVTMIACLRGVLRYLHGRGLMPLDLAGAIKAPRFTRWRVFPRRSDARTSSGRSKRSNRSLADRSPRLCDLDVVDDLWPACGRDRKAVPVGHRLAARAPSHPACQDRRARTLPLLRGPADALFDYLTHARPETRVREVFLRALAPYRPLCRGGAILPPPSSSPTSAAVGRVPGRQARCACLQAQPRRVPAERRRADQSDRGRPWASERTVHGLYLKLATDRLCGGRAGPAGGVP